MTFLQSQKSRWTQRLRGFPETLVVTDDAAHVAVGVTDGDLACFEVQSGKKLWERVAHEGGLTCMEAVPGGNRFLTGGEDGLLKCWSVDSADPLWSHEIKSDWVDSMAVSPAGRIALSSGSRIHLLDKEGRAVHEHNLDARAEHLLFNPDESYLIVVTINSIVLLELPSGEVLRELQIGTTPQVVRLSPDQDCLAIGLSDKSIRIVRIDQSEDQSAGIGPFRYRPKCAEWIGNPSHLFFTDGERAYRIAGKDLARFLEPATDESQPLESVIAMIPSAIGLAMALAVHPDSSVYAVGSDEGYLLVAGVEDETIRTNLRPASDGLCQLHWPGSGTDLLYATESGVLGLLSVPLNNRRSNHG